MFIRHVTMKLRANTRPEFTTTIERQVIPMLRKQKGFRDEITFMSRERLEVVANSFWETAEDAAAYNRTGYPQVLKTLAKVIEGTPTVETFEVANSTFHHIAARVA